MKKHSIVQMGKWLLDEPVSMILRIRKKSRKRCDECGSIIEVGESYWSDGDFSAYCLACIGVEGDPVDLLAEDPPEFNYDE